MALDTVADYVRDARVLLQDTVATYRFADSELVEALNLGLLEIRRLRPELMRGYFNTAIPTFTSANMTAAVPLDYQYRVALLYYVCGNAQLRDDENTQDQRATIFLNKFTSQMLVIQS